MLIAVKSSERSDCHIAPAVSNSQLIRLALMSLGMVGCDYSRLEHMEFFSSLKKFR
jgi:hypothetical protein